MELDREQLITEYMRECGLPRDLAEEVADEHIQIHNENEALFANRKRIKKTAKVAKKITTDKEFVAKAGCAIPKRSPHYKIKLFKLNKCAYQRWKMRPKLYPHNLESLFRPRFEADNYHEWIKSFDFPKGHGSTKDHWWHTWEVFDWIQKHNYTMIKNIH